MEDKGYYKKVTVRFYAELNDFLKKEYRQKAYEHNFKGCITVKDVLESLGVPHTSVDLVLVNSQPADFSQRIREGDYLSVYPVFETFDISPVRGNQRKPLRATRFVVDAHLGKVARKLRLLGFDSVYHSGISDEEILNLAEAGNRIILTRDRALLKSSRVMHGYYVRSSRTMEQLSEIIEKFDLVSQFLPFTRCLECNHLLEDAEPEEIRHRVDDDTFRIFRKFFRCSGCKKVYWEGSHYERMNDFIQHIRHGRITGGT